MRNELVQAVSAIESAAEGVLFSRDRFGAPRVRELHSRGRTLWVIDGLMVFNDRGTPFTLTLSAERLTLAHRVLFIGGAEVSAPLRGRTIEGVFEVLAEQLNDILAPSQRI